MSASKCIQDQYNAVCLQLGDRQYKLDILKKEIEDLKEQLKNLNRIAPIIRSKEIETEATVVTSNASDTTVDLK